MTPDPRKDYRLRRAFIWSPLRQILDPPQNILLTNVIADELHLLLRITDKLLENIDEVLEKDAIKYFNKPKGRPKQS